MAKVLALEPGLCLKKSRFNIMAHNGDSIG
jgi:hypothetical protein